jgi:hypothetical protein
MKRTFATTTLAITLLGIGACKGGAGDAVKYIPDNATLIAGINVGDVMKTQTYTEIMKPLVEKDDTKEMLDAAAACNLGTDKWKSIVFALASDMKNGVAVINADGIGKDDNLNCAAGKMKEKSGKDAFKIEEKDGKKQLTGLDDGGVGYIVNENTLVIASKDWATPVAELIDGKGKAAIDGSLKDVYGRADTGKNIWVAGVIPTDMAKMTEGSPASGAKDAAVSLDFSSGLAVTASVGFGSADDATKKKDEMQKMWDENKAMASGAAGLPQTAIDSVKIGTKDNAVTVEAALAFDDVKKLSALAGNFM